MVSKCGTLIHGLLDNALAWLKSRTCGKAAFNPLYQSENKHYLSADVSFKLCTDYLQILKRHSTGHHNSHGLRTFNVHALPTTCTFTVPPTPHHPPTNPPHVDVPVRLLHADSPFEGRVYMTANGELFVTTTGMTTTLQSFVECWGFPSKHIQTIIIFTGASTS
jgi:hypothetical protein